MKFDIRIAINSRELINISGFPLLDNGITFLLGESGIGKSLIARAIYGLLDPDLFTITINHQDYTDYLKSEFCREIRESGFFVFQEPSSHLNPLMTISDQLTEGSMAGHHSTGEILQSLWPKTDPESIRELTRIFPQPFRPSGGEKQRVLLAMALQKMRTEIPESKNVLYIFDEPTGSLDNFNRDLFLDLLFKRYRRNPVPVLIISHDYSMISRISQAYPELLQSISYQELSRSAAGLTINKFSPGRYLTWLDQIRPADIAPEGTPLLELANDFEIYDRLYYASSDPEGNNRVNLKIYANDLTYLKAGSGVGKTTLAKILIGLNQAQNLKMNIDDEKISGKTSHRFWRKNLWAEKIGMVFQHADEALNLNAKVRDVFSGLPRKKRPNEKRLLAEISYYFENQPGAAFLDQKIFSLSGGQKQRLNLLRTFLLDTKLIILDEPLNGLDFDSMCKIIDIINSRNKQGQGILLISHNEEIFDALIPENRRYYLHCREINT